MMTRRGGRATDLERTRSLEAGLGVGLVERDLTVIKLGVCLILGGGRLFMLAGILAKIGSRPRGLTGVPEAEESSELLLLIAESKMLLEKNSWNLTVGTKRLELQVILLWSTAPVVRAPRSHVKPSASRSHSVLLYRPCGSLQEAESKYWKVPW
jgi:hypothetical protein